MSTNQKYNAISRRQEDHDAERAGEEMRRGHEPHVRINQTE